MPNWEVELSDILTEKNVSQDTAPKEIQYGDRKLIVETGLSLFDFILQLNFKLDNKPTVIDTLTASKDLLVIPYAEKRNLQYVWTDGTIPLKADLRKRHYIQGFYVNDAHYLATYGQDSENEPLRFFIQTTLRAKELRKIIKFNEASNVMIKARASQLDIY